MRRLRAPRASTGRRHDFDDPQKGGPITASVIRRTDATGDVQSSTAACAEQREDKKSGMQNAHQCTNAHTLHWRIPRSCISLSPQNDCLRRINRVAL